MQFELEFGDVETPTRQPRAPEKRKIHTSTAVVVTPSLQSGRKATPLERRFDKLWVQLEAKQSRQETFETEVERARLWIQTELSEKREEYKRELIKQTEKLISHLGKKSLASWQRQVLASWIEENFERIERFGGAELPDLVRRYYSAKLTSLSKTERAAMEAYYDESVDDILAEVNKEFGDEDEDDSVGEGATDDTEHEDSADDANYYQQSGGDPEEESFAEKLRAAQAKTKRQTFDKSIVNKLFRRTAKALHPDHEQDDVIRDKKQALMKTLLQARKTGNVAQIFKMYREHVDSASIEIDLPDLKPMIDLLVQQIADLDNLFYEKTQESAIHSWVGNRLSGKSGKSRLDSFAELKKDLEQDIKRTKLIHPHLASLAKLKPLLEERYEMDVFGYF